MKKRYEPVDGRNAEIIEDVVSFAQMSGVTQDLLFKIRLCVEEVEENILCYSGTTWVDVEVGVKGGCFTVTFKDGGIHFDPLGNNDPDIAAPLDERGIGGLGILICKKMMDSVEYRFEHGCNIFTMSKRLF